MAGIVRFKKDRGVLKAELGAMFASAAQRWLNVYKLAGLPRVGCC